MRRTPPAPRRAPDLKVRPTGPNRLTSSDAQPLRAGLRCSVDGGTGRAPAREFRARRPRCDPGSAFGSRPRTRQADDLARRVPDARPRAGKPGARRARRAARAGFRTAPARNAARRGRHAPSPRTLPRAGGRPVRLAVRLVASARAVGTGGCGPHRRAPGPDRHANARRGPPLARRGDPRSRAHPSPRGRRASSGRSRMARCGTRRRGSPPACAIAASRPASAWRCCSVRRSRSSRRTSAFCSLAACRCPSIRRSAPIRSKSMRAARPASCETRARASC